jgi:hypothetical protein
VAQISHFRWLKTTSRSNFIHQRRTAPLFFSIILLDRPWNNTTPRTVALSSVKCREDAKNIGAACRNTEMQFSCDGPGREFFFLVFVP